MKTVFFAINAFLLISATAFASQKLAETTDSSRIKINGNTGDKLDVGTVCTVKRSQINGKDLAILTITSRNGEKDSFTLFRVNEQGQPDVQSLENPKVTENSISNKVNGSDHYDFEMSFQNGDWSKIRTVKFREGHLGIAAVGLKILSGVFGNDSHGNEIQCDFE